MPAWMMLAWAITLPATASAAEPALREVIDAQVQAAWKRENISPAAVADDAEFHRRVHLDLVGDVPSYQETVEFLESTAADKRATLIDRLLDEPRFAQHQADLWDLILFGRNPPGYDTDKRDGIQAWLRKQFSDNTPYDEMVRQILRAEGNTVDDGPPMFLVQYRNQPEDATEAITQTFLGVQLQCARCHDHPFEPWTQLDFYGMAAFLARLNVVTVGKKDNLTMYAIGEKSSGDILFTGPVTEQQPGKKGEPVSPRFMHGAGLEEPPLPEDFKEVKFEANKPPPKPLFSRKDHLADWIAGPENPYFARAAANRVWAQFMGRGLVHPVDNMSPSNRPSHPELLDTLAASLVEHKFDLKWYMRELCNTQTYQLSSAGPVADALPAWFEQARTRPLSAEELAAAWRTATGFEQAEQAAGKKPSDDRYRPLGKGYLVRYFGQPNNGVGDFQGGVHEHLYLNNGPLASTIATGKGSLYEALVDAATPLEDRVERLYLSTLCRRPSDDERQHLVEYLSADKSPERAKEAIWVLLTCSEFRFNH